MRCRRRVRCCCCGWHQAPTTPIPHRSLFDGTRLTTRHTDRRGFRIVQIDRGQGTAPDATGVDAEHTAFAAESKGRPVAEHEALVDAGAARYPEPRQPWAGSRIRFTLLFEIHAPVGGTKPQPRQHVDGEALSLRASEHCTRMVA